MQERHCNELGAVSKSIRADVFEVLSDGDNYEHKSMTTTSAPSRLLFEGLSSSTPEPSSS